MFNTGQNEYVAQFMLHRKEVVNYIQRTLADKGYLVAQMIRSGMKQSIPLPPPVDPNDPCKEDLEAIRTEDVKTIAKRRQKLKQLLLKGYAFQVLANYQVTKTGVPYRASPDNTGVVFLQQGGRGGQGGCGGRGGQGDKSEGGKAKGGSDDVSTLTGKTSRDGARTNSKGESHCFNCGSLSHWAYECPQLSG